MSGTRKAPPGSTPTPTRGAAGGTVRRSGPDRSGSITIHRTASDTIPIHASRSLHAPRGSERGQTEIDLRQFKPRRAMTKLTPERWRAVSQHLDRVLELSEDERAAWLSAFRRQ